MNITEYQLAAKRTFPNLASKEDDLLHMKLGVYTEVAEIFDVLKKNLAYGKPLDVVNIGEELADCCWYFANEATIEGQELNTQSFVGWYLKLRPIHSTTEVIGTLEDFLGYYVGVFLDTDLIDTNLKFALIRQIAEFYGLDIYTILENNINKLKVRYPEKFTQEAALNRNLEAERIELEK